MVEQLPFCECGCGGHVAKRGNRFIWGHNWRGKKHDLKSIKKMVGPKSPDHCKAISEGQKKRYEDPKEREKISNTLNGHQVSEETRASISDGIKNSEAAKVATDAMRGGDDIVRHHFIYDHDDLSKYTIEMTRSQHQSLHRNMQLLGLEVPHINTGHENEEELKLMEYLKKIESEPKGL